jgi:hypothetical protein
MRKYSTAILVTLVMVTGLLAITNPDRKNYRMFDYVEGRLEHNYGIFSTYMQSGYALSDDGKYKVRRRYLGIAATFFEIKPEKISVDSL